MEEKNDFEQEKLLSTLKSLPKVDAPADFSNIVLGRISREKTGRKTIFIKPWFISSVAASILVIIATVSYIQFSVIRQPVISNPPIVNPDAVLQNPDSQSGKRTGAEAVRKSEKREKDNAYPKSDAQPVQLTEPHPDVRIFDNSAAKPVHSGEIQLTGRPLYDGKEEGSIPAEEKSKSGTEKISLRKDTTMSGDSAKGTRQKKRDAK